MILSEIPAFQLGNSSFQLGFLQILFSEFVLGILTANPSGISAGKYFENLLYAYVLYKELLNYFDKGRKSIRIERELELMSVGE